MQPRIAPASVLLVRHGRTAFNAGGRLRGRLDPPLDDVGRAEADALARTFAGFHVVVVVSSPLSRSLDTAARIAAACGVPLEIDERLVDRDYGEWAGRSPEELVRRFGSVDSAPGVEPHESLTDRAVAAVTAIAEASRGTTSAAVAHDAVNRAVLSRLVPALGPPETIPQRTGCWNRMVLSGSSWSAPVVGALPTLST
jgi:broad specificity phosphatase PhoE